MLSTHRLAVAALVAALCPSAAVAQGSTGPHVWDALTGLEPEAATPGWTARFHRFPLPGGMPCTQPTRSLGPGQLFPFQGSLGFLPVDLGALPQPNGSVAATPGESWSFQLWYRDANPLPTSNFSTAVTALLE